MRRKGNGEAFAPGFFSYLLFLFSLSLPFFFCVFPFELLDFKKEKSYHRQYDKRKERK